MTTKLDEFSQSCSLHEKLLADELRLEFENYKSCGHEHAEGERCGDECEETQHYSPSNGERVVNKSAAPTVYGYGRQKAIEQTKTDASSRKAASKFVAKICGDKTDSAPRLPTENVEEVKVSEKQISHYNERFHPTKEYIYTPNCAEKAPVNETKAMLGQTTFVPSLEENTETVWRNNFLKTQTMNDEQGNRAESGLEPIQNVFKTVGQDGEEFVIDFKSKPKDLSNSVGGYIEKELRRDAATYEPKEHFLSTVRTQAFEKSPGCRPYQSGNAYVRRLKTEDLGVERLCKELKFDTRTTNRQAHGEINEEMQVIAYNEQVKAHKRYIADRNKPSPVGNGFPAQMITTQQYFSKNVEDVENQRKFEEDQRLTEKCVQRAIEMFGGDEQQAREWVSTLPLEKQKQLVFLGDEAVRRQQNPLFEQTKE